MAARASSWMPARAGELPALRPGRPPAARSRRAGAGRAGLGRDRRLHAARGPRRPHPAERARSAAPGRRAALFQDATTALLDLQRVARPDWLPAYDAALLQRELQLFPDWYLAQHKELQIDQAMRATLDKTFALLVERNLAAPGVLVHRDFMPRNLMLPRGFRPADPAAPTRRARLPGRGLGSGHLRHRLPDARRIFLSWEEDFVLDITIRYWERARKAGLLDFDGWSQDFGAFYRAVDWMALQRHPQGRGHLRAPDAAATKPSTWRTRRASSTTSAAPRCATAKLTPCCALIGKGRGLGSGDRLRLRQDLSDAAHPPAHAAADGPADRTHARGRPPCPGAAAAARATHHAVRRSAAGGEWDATVLKMGRSSVEVEIGAHHAVEREPAPRGAPWRSACRPTSAWTGWSRRRPSSASPASSR